MHPQECGKCAQGQPEGACADSENGLASGWKDSDEFITESEENSFSCWLDHEFSENHYSIKIEEEKLLIDSLMFKELGCAYIKESLKYYFHELKPDFRLKPPVLQVVKMLCEFHLLQ